MGFLGTALNRWALAVLAAVALAGYAIGRDAAPSGARQTSPMRSAVVANVIVRYPREWTRTTRAPLEALALSEATLLSPAGRSQQSGLLVGGVPAGEAAPLPLSFVRALATPPSAEVVSLAETQAYRYSGLSVAGFEGSVTVFAIPEPGGSATIAACYARPGDAAFLERCAGVVAGVTQLAQTAGYDLVPEAAYARRLARLVGELGARRSDVARTRGAGATQGELARLGAGLSQAYARAAGGLAGLEAPAPARAAESVLASALEGASSAYAALAGSRRPLESARARTRVREAETLVSEGLERFSLLGYG